MQINISKAIKQFFPSPSLEQVYFEAVANSIDADASAIEIVVELDSFGASETLRVSITDNGTGFSEENFRKFSKLLETEEEHHKGLGRLVFLSYFKSVDVNSISGEIKRTFRFDEAFNGNSELEFVEKTKNETKLVFSGYRRSRINKYDYVKANSIRDDLVLHFFPVLHLFKIQKKPLRITVSVKTKEENIDYGFKNDTIVLDVADLPDLQKTAFNWEYLDLYEQFTLHYSISENNQSPSPITAVIAENRTIPIEILTKDKIPKNFEVIFLLQSNFFDGKVNPSRQKLEIEDHVLKTLKQLMIDQIGRVLDKHIPDIRVRNQKIKNSLDSRYPHLGGYFPEHSVGLIDRDTAIDNAQKRFFKDQKDILEAEELSDDQFQKSLNVSSRILTEYILYRSKIIKKLQEISERDSEEKIHNLIVPKRRVLSSNDFAKDIYSNNAWLLDDKFMSYSKILSDKELKKLLNEISLDNETTTADNSRPDISIIFSNDPEKHDEGIKNVDVVVVEVKKMGLGLAKREEVISQLRQRARKLLEFYPDRIQRMWFYGIVDFSPELLASIKEDGYIPMFSKDKVHYKEQTIIGLKDGKEVKGLAGIYLISFEALIGDAQMRNDTFLQILKDSINNTPKATI
jgi:hypothetical protein